MKILNLCRYYVIYCGLIFIKFTPGQNELLNIKKYNSL